MNWLFIIIGCCFLIGIAVGIYRGAIKIAVSLVATVLTFVIVFFASPYVGEAIRTMTPVGTFVEEQIVAMISGMAADAVGDETGVGSGDEERVRSALNAAGITEEQLNALGITVEDIANGNISADELAEKGISRNLLTGEGQSGGEESQLQEEAELPRDMQIAAIEGADIPEIFKELLLTNNNSEIYEKLGANSFISYVAKYMTKLLINIAAFLLTFVLVTIVLRAVLFALNIIADLPVIGFFNRLGGGLLGMAGVLILVWVAFVVITLLYTTGIGKELFGMIRENPFLEFLYENNPIMRLATVLRG